MQNRYSQLLYNPFLRRQFAYSYRVQAEEFQRLFGKSPSRIDGHHHMHLCANVLFSRLIPAGMLVRRNFSFWPGEKSLLNRTYRKAVDYWLSRRYQLADYFFDLTQAIRELKFERVAMLAKTSNVELMTHPVVSLESELLMSDQFEAAFQHLQVGHYDAV